MKADVTIGEDMQQHTFLKPSPSKERPRTRFSRRHRRKLEAVKHAHRQMGGACFVFDDQSSTKTTTAPRNLRGRGASQGISGRSQHVSSPAKYS